MNNNTYTRRTQAGGGDRPAEDDEDHNEMLMYDMTKPNNDDAEINFGLGATRKRYGSYLFVEDAHTDLLVPGMQAPDGKDNRFGDKGQTRRSNERLDYFVRVANDLTAKVITFNQLGTDSSTDKKKEKCPVKGVLNPPNEKSQLVVLQLVQSLDKQSIAMFFLDRPGRLQEVLENVIALNDNKSLEF